MPIKTALTLPSSVQCWLRGAARQIHRLGERAEYALLGELVAGSSNPKALLARVEAFSAIDGDVLRAYGGDRLLSTLWAVK
jgi:hypothetical protein